MTNETNKTLAGFDDIQLEMENTPIDEIDNEFVNLFMIGTDSSSSMTQHTNAMQDSLNRFQKSILNSKQADEILMARADFNSTIDISGYKPVNEFDTNYNASGTTVLHDVIVEGVDRLVQYMDHLKRNGMRVKAVFAIFSDGEDVGSKASHAMARQKIEELNRREITTAFIAFGDNAKGIAQSLGFKNPLDVGASESELRKAFDCLSKSVIESSKSVTADGDQFWTV